MRKKERKSLKGNNIQILEIKVCLDILAALLSNGQTTTIKYTKKIQSIKGSTHHLGVLNEGPSKAPTKRAFTRNLNFILVGSLIFSLFVISTDTGYNLKY